jgi:hypothetical protein
MFEFENDLLVVDELIYDPGLASGVVVRIGTEHYMINNAATKPILEKYIGPYKRKPYKDWSRAMHNWEFVFRGMMPRNGFEVEVGRPVTKEEFDALVEEYGLGKDDISNEFIDEKGGLFGEKYKKSYTSTQIRVSELDAIPLEQKLISKGIEASNGSPGRVNIRTEWGGAREGAGRPSTGRRLTRMYVTEEEEQKLRNYLSGLRK